MGCAGVTATELSWHAAHWSLIYGQPLLYSSPGGDYVVCGDSSYVAQSSPHWGLGGEGGKNVNSGHWSNVTLTGSQSPARVVRFNRWVCHWVGPHWKECNSGHWSNVTLTGSQSPARVVRFNRWVCHWVGPHWKRVREGVNWGSLVRVTGPISP